MKTPKGLQPLLDDGMIDSVVRSLKSGKEASVYIVSCGGRLRCAKVYKEAERRGFHKLAQYQEGRKTRSSRDARAMGRLLETQFAPELWKLYEAGELQPESMLTGRFAHDPAAADVDAVLTQIEDERREAEARQRRREAADAA